MRKSIIRLSSCATATALVLLTGGAQSQSTDLSGSKLDLAQQPLFVAAGVDPNIMFLLDNSGSMNNIVPDAPYDSSTTQSCPEAIRLAPSGRQVDLRIAGDGVTPYFRWVRTSDPNSYDNYDWGTSATINTRNSSRYDHCFDPTQNYSARLYGDGGSKSNIKYPDGYLPAQYTGHYLNWYFSTTGWGTDARQKPGTKRRMDIAKQAATNLIEGPEQLERVRVGLASYNSANGATINVGVSDLTDTQRSTLTTRINGLTPSGSTPLAESLHDIGRYFVGESNPQYDGPLTLHPGAPNQSVLDDDVVFNHSPVYASGVSNASPIQFFCQQNFAVLLTDGRPQADRFFSGDNDSDLRLTPTLAPELRDYDGDCSGANGSNCINENPSYDRKRDQGYESAGSDYLDDIALALRDIDLRPDLKNLEGEEVKNNILTYTIGFADDQVINDPLMQDTADNGGGEFLQAANASELSDAFASAVASIRGKTKPSATGIAHNTGSVRADSQVYLARFSPDDWTGELLAYALHDGSGDDGCTTDDPLGHICPNPVWEAGCALTGGYCEATGKTIAQPDWQQRQVLTFNPTAGADGKGEGRPLEWGEINGLQRNLLTLNVPGVTESILSTADERGQNRIAYLRGDRSREQQNGGPYRDRKSLLGDIVNASPLHVGTPTRRYPAIWADKLSGPTPENNTSAESYAQFRQTYAGRMRMVYAGANDAFLHGFESGKFDTTGELQSGTNKGEELIAYMPSKAFYNARHLLNPDYNHRYFVDGRLSENDVFFGGEWHTILVGTLGAGGQGLFALDITDPDAFFEANAASLVMWEFNDTDEELLDSQLGYTFGKPAIVRLHNGRWGVLVANGYNATELLKPRSLLLDDTLDPYSATGEGALYILDAETGDLIERLETATGSSLFDRIAGLVGRRVPNGLASIFPVDKDGDFITDYVYAGDLFGQVWRFDLTSTDSAQWKTSDFGAGSPTPLFIAEDATGNPQFITTQVQVAAHPDGITQGAMVYFGTGKYLENADRTPNTSITHSFYGIRDKNFPGVSSGASGITRSELVAQEINATESAPGNTFRRVTENPVDYSAKHGWYLDLVESGKPNEGEMVIADPVVRGKLVIFPTIIPSEHPCTPGGSGYLMAVDARTGGRPVATPFDVNGDGVFTLEDKLGFGDAGNESAAGIRLDVASGTPSFVLPTSNDRALIPTFDGNPTEELMNVGVKVYGRETWRQLR